MSTRVLVTGHRGLIGPYVVQELERQGYGVVGFDLRDGQDIRDASALATSLAGCDLVIHLAAADNPLPAEVIVDTNVVGTKVVLDQAIAAGCQRVVMASSVDALGIFLGEAPPDYLPLDDGHPARPGTPYGAAKRAAEMLAERTASSTGLQVICLRPPGVCDDAMMATIRAHRRQRPSYEWDPIWEYGAWIHAEDLAQALVAACSCKAPPGSFACVLVAASDINSDEHTSHELSGLVHPDLEWRGGDEYARCPRRSLIDGGPARQLLGWSPKILWTDRP